MNCRVHGKGSRLHAQQAIWQQVLARHDMCADIASQRVSRRSWTGKACKLISEKQNKKHKTETVPNMRLHVPPPLPRPCLAKVSSFWWKITSSKAHYGDKTGQQANRGPPLCHGAARQWQCHPCCALPGRGLSRRQQAGGGSPRTAALTPAAWADSALAGALHSLCHHKSELP